MSLSTIILFMLALIALNMRLYLAIIAATLCYFLFIAPLPLGIAVQRLVGPTQNASLLAIPFFILLGTLMAHTGIAERMLKIADLIVGRVRGGMALANVMLSTLMGGLSASNLADAAMTARMMVPEMEKRGYDRAFSSALTAASSLITPIIPPGIALIIYALLANVSVGRMFMAGILPGLLLAALLMLTTYIVSVRRGYKPSRQTAPSVQEVGSTLFGAWPAIFLVVAVIGGIRANIFTPTEAGAFAVLFTIFIGFIVSREMRLSHVGDALVETGKSTASIMLVIMASSALAWVFSLEQVGQQLASVITATTSNPWVFLLIMNGVFLGLGLLIEGTALMIVLVPILLPTVLELGIDPVHFGIVMIVNLSIGTMTPPVGTVMLVVCNITRVSVGAFTREATSLYVALLAALLLVTFVPAISLALAG
ncbi:TRAP transporter large permease [Aureimonas sp. OT7]|uniref:TRAP transporter large permease protein n=1 Tax=Aureimonas altamirensis TaxID=370622 RepID=A0A0B1PXR9_9HYPH|nr:MULTISPECIES: TRAP transporter large permease [Aureimonas]KHJ53328.1 C4-dicarboxylate ABC transporter [Aureimonas altamirensis]QOG06593.1 TRAP transporter large permease [Aureimonas sp. OT7]